MRTSNRPDTHEILSRAFMWFLTRSGRECGGTGKPVGPVIARTQRIAAHPHQMAFDRRPAAPPISVFLLLPEVERRPALLACRSISSCYSGLAAFRLNNWAQFGLNRNAQTRLNNIPRCFAILSQEALSCRQQFLILVSGVQRSAASFVLP